MWILFLGLLIIFEAGADIIAKEYQIHSGVIRFTAAILGYVLANIFWLIALKDGAGLTQGALIFSVGSAMLAIIIGLVLYKETLSPMQMIGLGLGLVSLVLLVWE